MNSLPTIRFFPQLRLLPRPVLAEAEGGVANSENRSFPLPPL